MEVRALTLTAIAGLDERGKAALFLLRGGCEDTPRFVSRPLRSVLDCDEDAEEAGS